MIYDNDKVLEKYGCKTCMFQSMISQSCFYTTVKTIFNSYLEEFIENTLQKDYGHVVSG